MKKIKFLNGKFLYAVIALAGSLLLASCEREDLDATFDAGPAVINFNVTVIDVLSGDVTSEAIITGADAISATGGYDGGTVTITATYDGVSASQTVEVASLKAGGQATYNVLIVLSSTYEITLEQVEKTDSIGTLGEASHSHNGDTWCLNDNDYILTWNLTYTVYNQSEVTDVEVVDDAFDYSALETAFTYNYNEEATLKVQVSAWAYYKVWTTKTVTTAKYKISRSGGSELCTLTVESTTSTSAQYQETAFNSHYEYGHGHGTHGGSDNAGGGIVYSD
ncbi:MAG: DUF3869 domain-containing protein [Bacteroides sp.]|nr:DUF3869 domain-containing protein [Bacteroides sp.]